MTDTERINVALDRWEDGMDAGLEIHVQQLCGDCLHLADRLATRISRLRPAEWLRRQARPVPRPLAPSCYAAGDTVADRFRLSRLLAQGGHGEVWCGTDLVTRREVAVKLLKADSCRTRGQTLEAEARNASLVRHRNIVPLYFSGQDGGAHYLVLRLIEGVSLAVHLARSRPSVPFARRIAREIAAALVHVHDRGLIHRDLKPDNILLDAAGRVYLTDFGIALSRTDGSRGGANGTGSLAYMSPEQLLPGTPLDGRCDVYALGAILFEMLAGRPPFVDGVRANLGGRLPPRVTQFNRLVPEALADIVDACLAPVPSGRFASAAELLVALGGDPSTADLVPADDFGAASWEWRLQYLEILGGVKTVPAAYLGPVVELLQSPLPVDRRRVERFLLGVGQSAVPALLAALRRTTRDDLEYRAALVRLLVRVAPMSPAVHATVAEMGLCQSVLRSLRPDDGRSHSRSAVSPAVRAALVAGVAVLVGAAVWLAAIGVSSEAERASVESFRPARAVYWLVVCCMVAGLVAARWWRASVAILSAVCMSTLSTGLMTGLESRLYSTTDAVNQALRLPAN